MRLAGLLLILFSIGSYAEIPKTGGVHPSVYVLVEGHGTTYDQAKQNAFTTAIEQTVGQVIISDKEVNGDQLVKEFIGGYSAGYIDDYELLSQSDDQGQWTVKMNVVVASSKIAQRMMSSGNKTLMLNGENLQDSLDSQLYQRSQGDRLIAEVVSSYPRNALVVNSGKTEFALSRYREVYLDVPYEIHWSKLWLEAFDEAVSIVAVNNKSCNGILVKYDNKINLSPTPGLFTKVTDTPCGKAADLKISLKNNKNYFAHVNSYYFADLQTVQVINNEFLPDIGRPNIGLQVSLVDAGGNIVDSRCAKIDSSLFVDWYRPEMEVESTSVGRPAINGQASVYGVLRLHNVKNIDQVIKINLNVEKTCT